MSAWHGVDVIALTAPVFVAIASVFAILWAKERERRICYYRKNAELEFVHQVALQKLDQMDWFARCSKGTAKDLATKNAQIDCDLAAVRRDLTAVRDELAAANAHIASDGNTGLVIEFGNALKTANDEVTRLQTKVVARAFKIPEASMPGEGRDR